MTERNRQADEESERSRTLTNVYLLVFFILLVGIGAWLADAMIVARKADDCIAAGRRNCAPISVPAREH
jgi:hypothetical protein